MQTAGRQEPSASSSAIGVQCFCQCLTACRSRPPACPCEPRTLVLHSQVPECRITCLDLSLQEYNRESKGPMSISAQAVITAIDSTSMLHFATLIASSMSDHSAIVSNYAPVQHQCEANLWENSCSGVVCLNDDMLIELGGVHAQR